MNEKKSNFQRKKFYPPVEDELGYVMAVKNGNTLFISGIIGHDNGIMHPEPEKQYRLVYRNIGEVLQTHGAKLSDIAVERVYYTEKMAGIDPLVRKRIRQETYGGEYPVSTWVQVQALAHPEAFIEVEVMAVIDE